MTTQHIELTDCFKHYTFDQDKVCTPEETIARFKKRLTEVDLDILKEVRRIDNGRLDIPVYFSVCGKDGRATIGTKKQMGKGGTPLQSQASACMELAERFSFFSFIKNPANFVLDTYPNLKAAGQPLLPLDRLLQSVHDQTTDTALLERLLADIPIQWVWATNLTRGKQVLMPFSWFFAINEFNGPSAGNSHEEAISQGICEIVERHVCAVIGHEQRRVPLINPASLRDPVSRELLEKFTRHGIDIYLNDFSLDTGIPTVGALGIDRSTFPMTSEIVYTAGTTPNPEKAVIRALTEVAQLAGDFNTKSNYVASGLPKPLSMDEVDYITHPGRTVDIDQLPDLSDNNIKVEVEGCLASLGRLGMDVYIVNTMHPLLRIPTIYTIIPGCHFRERSRSGNAGLFAAKLVAEQVTDPNESNRCLAHMGTMLKDAYFIEFYLGRNLLTLGQFDEAMVHFNKSLCLNPTEEDLPYIYSYMGSCLKELGQYDEAIVQLNKGTAVDTVRPDLHNLLGFCHYKLGNHETAVSHFSRTVELNPSSAIDYANLGVNYRKLNNREEAVKYFQLALSLDPTIEFARDNLTQLGVEG